jgi:radical SAM superfamily enzyme YgiQ (UPF0313 family)
MLGIGREEVVEWLMVVAGTESPAVVFEAVSQNQYRVIEKLGFHDNPVSEVVPAVASAGFLPLVDMIFALPGETDADRAQTLDLREQYRLARSLSEER